MPHPGGVWAAAAAALRGFKSMPSSRTVSFRRSAQRWTARSRSPSPHATSRIETGRKAGRLRVAGSSQRSVGRWVSVTRFTAARSCRQRSYSARGRAGSSITSGRVLRRERFMASVRGGGAVRCRRDKACTRGRSLKTTGRRDRRPGAPASVATFTNGRKTPGRTHAASHRLAAEDVGAGQDDQGGAGQGPGVRDLAEDGGAEQDGGDDLGVGEGGEDGGRGEGEGANEEELTGPEEGAGGGHQQPVWAGCRSRLDQEDRAGGDEADQDGPGEGHEGIVLAAHETREDLVEGEE